MVTTVFVALDGSDVADSALAPAVQLATRADAQLVLLAARWPGTDAPGMERRLDARIAVLGAAAETRVVTDLDPVDAIVAGGR